MAAKILTANNNNKFITSVWTKTFKYLIMSGLKSQLIVEYFSECW